MLRYLNHGLRPFGDHPMPVHKRLNWEFYAVVSGRLAPSFEPEQPLEFASDELWIFPPNRAHGWVGEPGQRCEIVVFHFSVVPAELERRVRAQGHAAVTLTEAEQLRVRRLEAELREHYWKTNPVSELHFERALMELSLLVLEKPATARAEGARGMAGGRVDASEAGRVLPTPAALARVLAAENWFRQHLHERPSLTRVAQAVGFSPGHLRRVFYAVREMGPHEVFSRLRMEQAMQLMAHSDRKLEDVAGECGFACASQFCQAFKSRYGTTPTCWRKHAYSQYQQPGAASASSDLAAEPASLAVSEMP